MKAKINKFLKNQAIFLIIGALWVFPLAGSEVLTSQTKLASTAKHRQVLVSTAPEIKVVPAPTNSQTVLLVKNNQSLPNSCLQPVKLSASLNFLQDFGSVNLDQPANCFSFIPQIREQSSSINFLRVTTLAQNQIKLAVRDLSLVFESVSWLPGGPLSVSSLWLATALVLIISFRVSRRTIQAAALPLAEELFMGKVFTQAQLQIFRC